MRVKKEILFYSFILIAILFTIGFTLYYIRMVTKPVALRDETVYIDFDGSSQEITLILTLSNRLPMNAVVPLSFYFPESMDISEASIEEVTLQSVGAITQVEFKYNNNVFSTEIAFPPFANGKLLVRYKQEVSGNSLIAGFKSRDRWASAPDKVDVYLNLPEGYSIGMAFQQYWVPSHVEGFQYLTTIRSFHGENRVVLFDIPFTRESDDIH